MLFFLSRNTQIPQDILEDYINELRQVYTPEAYNLFTNNCNNFSNELATFLTGQPIPVSMHLCKSWATEIQSLAGIIIFVVILSIFPCSIDII